MTAFYTLKIEYVMGNGVKDLLVGIPIENRFFASLSMPDLAE
jgi:hypothetical protein